MLVLPLEHKRMQSILKLESETEYFGELTFWLYHIRDLSRALDKTQSKQEEI
jgi:DNA mismatch repair ATPase MutS